MNKINSCELEHLTHRALRTGETLPRRIYHIGCSGGKDSTALLLWMIHESGIPRNQMIATFCDTQNEARETYDHLALLSAKVFPIQWIETDGFASIVMRKKIFPTKHRRFCTKELKLIPTMRFIDDLCDWRCKSEDPEEIDKPENWYMANEVIPVSGVRRDESEDRKNLPEWGAPEDSFFGLAEWRPLIDWKIEDVLTIHAKYGIPLNPLYSQGARRVGCFPCIHSNKSEIRAMIKHSPERIDQIREFELSIDNPNGYSSFFARNKVPARFRTQVYKTASGKEVKVCSIDDVVAWAKSGWRAKGNAPDIGGLYQFELDKMPPKLCLSQYQACE